LTKKEIDNILRALDCLIDKEEDTINYSKLIFKLKELRK
jgi:hypothetical protein